MEKAKKMGTFIILTVGMSLIFELAYLRNSFYIPMCIALNVTNHEFGILLSIYSLAASITYVIGGFISDRIESRAMLFLPFMLTGILGFAFSTLPSFFHMKVIFALMGVTTVMTYFSFTIRIFRMFGKELGQGKMFGLMESGKGFSGGVIFLLMLVLFNSLGGGVFGFRWIIKAYSIIIILVGLGVVLLVPDEYVKLKINISLKEQIKAVVSNKQIWYLSIIVFIMYSLYGILSFLPSFFIEVFGVSLEQNSMFSGGRYIIQIFAPIALGLASDKVKSSYKVIFACLLICLVSGVFFMTLIDGSMMFLVSISNYFLAVFFIYGMKALYYASISETGIGYALTGSAMGIVGGIGFFPDTFLHQMIGSWIDDGVIGYTKMMIYMIALCIAGMIAVSMAYVSKEKTAKEY